MYVVPEQAPNAFATGRDPEHSSIAVTQGLLDMMNRVELEGVIGHEMSHVVDRDILLGTIVATLVGAVVLISEFFMRSWFWGGLGGRRGSDRNGGAAGAVLLAVGFVLLILAPIFGQLIRFAVSRQREYLADAEGALLTRYPPGLASALEEDRREPRRDALGQQRDRAPVAQPTFEGGRRQDGGAREDVQHAPAHRRSHQASGGDVKFPPPVVENHELRG